MQKKNSFLILVMLVLFLCVCGVSNALIVFGDFTSGTDSWIVGFSYSAVSGHTGTQNGTGLSQISFAGTNGVLTWTEPATTSPGVTSGGAVNTPFQSKDVRGDTSFQFRVAFTGTAADPTTSFQFYTQSGSGFTFQGSTSVFSQPVNGNFFTYTLPVDTSFIADSTQLRSIGINHYQGHQGVMTCYIDFCKSQGPLDPSFFADFLFGTEGWVANFDTDAILGTGGFSNVTDGLTRTAPSGSNGALEWVSLATTSYANGINSPHGGAVSSAYGSPADYSASKFVEWRIAVSISSANSGNKTVGAGLFAQGPYVQIGQNPELPLDGLFHTYSYSFDSALALNGAFLSSALNQIGINVFGHGSDVKFDVDYVKFKQTGTPILFSNSSTVVPAYNSTQTNMINGQTLTYTVFQGNPPFTWSLTSVAGNPGSLNTTSGATVIFTAANGISFVTVTDADGRSIRTPNQVVTFTDAPLAVESDNLK